MCPNCNPNIRYLRVFVMSVVFAIPAGLVGLAVGYGGAIDRDYAIVTSLSSGVAVYAGTWLLAGFIFYFNETQRAETVLEDIAKGIEKRVNCNHCLQVVRRKLAFEEYKKSFEV